MSQLLKCAYCGSSNIQVRIAVDNMSTSRGAPLAGFLTKDNVARMGELAIVGTGFWAPRGLFSFSRPSLYKGLWPCVRYRGYKLGCPPHERIVNTL